MKKKQRPSTGNQLRFGEDLPQHLLDELVRKQNEHTAQILANRVEWPEVGAVDSFDDLDRFDLAGTIFGYAGVVLLKGGNRGKKGKKQGGGARRPPALPNPAMVHAEVQKAVAHIPVAAMTGNIQVVELNPEFMDDTKVRYFRDSYIEIFSRCHIAFLEEVSQTGVAELENILKGNGGHKGYCSVENTRKQAVGFLVHPRLKVVKGPYAYNEIAEVQNKQIPDLRPAFCLDLEDTVTGEKFTVIVLHLKSMRGGPKVTAVVRYKQFEELVKKVGPNFAGLVGGDMNYILNDPNNRDGDPMYNAGFVLVAKNDSQATQIMGSRIDGYFVKGMKSTVDYYYVVPFFSNPKLGRTFTDHGLTGLEICCASKQSNQAANSSSTGKGGSGKGGGIKLVDPLQHRRTQENGGFGTPVLNAVARAKAARATGGSKKSRRRS